MAGLLNRACRLGCGLCLLPFLIGLVLPLSLIWLWRRGLLLHLGSRGTGRRASRIREEQRPSVTAELVCIIRAYLTRIRRCHDPIASRFLEADSRLFVELMVLANWLLGGFRNLLILSIMGRTHALDAFITASFPEGPQQLVILGAGLDARAYRMNLKNCRVFEVDAPASQAMKRRMVEGLPAQHRPAIPVVFCAVDFAAGQNFMDRLIEEGFDPQQQRTVFICEGVAMYLPLEAVDELLRNVAQRCAVGTRLAIQINQTTEVDAARMAYLSRLVRQLGEEFKWSMAPDDTDEAFFTPRGFRVIESLNTSQQIGNALRTFAPSHPLPASQRANSKHHIAFLEVN